MECSKWRGIALANTINQIEDYETDLAEYENNLRNNQGSFRSNRCCCNQSNTIGIIIEVNGDAFIYS